MRQRLVGLALALLLLLGCNPAEQTTAVITINAFRTAAQVSPLLRHPDLDRAASWQAARMARQRRIYHSRDLTVGAPSGWSILGENVAAGPSLSAALQALENSPPHRQNLIDTRFAYVGIGTVTRDGVVYLVQLFMGL